MGVGGKDDETFQSAVSILYGQELSISALDANCDCGDEKIDEREIPQTEKLP